MLFFLFFLRRKARVQPSSLTHSLHKHTHTPTQKPAASLCAVVRIQHLPFHPWTESVKQREPEPIRGLFCVAVCIKERKKPTERVDSLGGTSEKPRRDHELLSTKCVCERESSNFCPDYKLQTRAAITDHKADLCLTPKHAKFNFRVHRTLMFLRQSSQVW